ncbi:MAG: CDP-2,3-bis-(O-geranylgeranyl)-sn-glycerol synthase [Haloferacaceae archaeon]|jgi:CDP-2,3-bis-(O-geranylgeranyl)-sn-glycerol synthase|nr:CDP-2,3-bis-(O-geranylgeranyl)-sn-glycerol synthase [Haloferacaceae archaeon]
MWVASLLIAVWILLPTYIPNNVAVLVGGGRPLDGGRRYRGQRLLGDGKTVRGSVGGAIAGVLVAMGLTLLRPMVEPLVGITLPRFPPAVIVALPVGAIVGDIAGSFLKRRADYARGAALPLLDQLDFLIGAAMMTLLVAPGWLLATVSPAVAAIAVVMTPVLHRLANIVAYTLGLKQEPH